MSRDYYAVLSVSRNATTQQIRDRFRQLARERHPDRFNGPGKARIEREFQRLTEAFNVLSNPETRRQHDLELARPTPGASEQKGEIARVYIQRGKLAFRDQNYLEAAESFHRATQEEPGNAQAFYHLAQACRHQRRWLVRGRAAAVRACELEPLDPSYLKLAAELHLESGLAERAVKLFEEAAGWDPGDSEIQNGLEQARRAVRKASRNPFGRAG